MFDVDASGSQHTIAVRGRRRQRRLAAWLCLGGWPMVLLAPGLAMAGDPLAAIVADIDRGRFHEADQAIDRALQARGVADARALQFQRERMRRIRLDFGLDGATVRQRIRAQVPDLRQDEFQRWDAAAPMALVVEAGGQFTDWKGQPTVDAPDVLASNGKVHAETLQILNG